MTFRPAAVERYQFHGLILVQQHHCYRCVPIYILGQRHCQSRRKSQTPNNDFSIFLFLFSFSFSSPMPGGPQIKREPCQVSEITTSNNFGHFQSNQSTSTASSVSHSQHRAASTIVKIETTSPKTIAATIATSSSSTSTPTSNMDHTNSNQVQNGMAAPGRRAPEPALNSEYNFMKILFIPFRTGAIPVGIAVARQRLQAEHAQQHQQKENNRFGGIGITTDLGKFISHKPPPPPFSPPPLSR